MPTSRTRKTANTRKPTPPKTPTTPTVPASTDTPTPTEPEVSDELTFEYDGDTFTVSRNRALSLEYLDALYEAGIDDDDPVKVVGVIRALLGVDEARRLFKGRDVPHIAGFFTALNEAADAGNS